MPVRRGVRPRRFISYATCCNSHLSQRLPAGHGHRAARACWSRSSRSAQSIPAAPSTASSSRSSACASSAPPSIHSSSRKSSSDVMPPTVSLRRFSARPLCVRFRVSESEIVRFRGGLGIETTSKLDFRPFFEEAGDRVFRSCSEIRVFLREGGIYHVICSKLGAGIFMREFPE